MLRLGDLLAIVGGRSVLFLLLLGGDLVPVADHDHVLVGQPQRARRNVVEDDARTVRAEHGRGGLGQARDRLRLVARGVRACAHERARTRPGAVGAAPVEDGRRGGALLAAVRGLLALDRLSVQGHGHQLVTGCEEDRGGLVAGELQDGAAHVVLGQVAHLAAGQDELVAGLVVDDRLIADRGNRRGPCGREVFDLRSLGTPGLALARQRHELGGPRRVREDRSRVRHRHDAVAQVVGDRVLAQERHGGRLVRAASPQKALVGVEDRQDGAALDLDRVVGQGDGLSEGEGGRTHRSDRAAHGLTQRHVTALLADVEGRGLHRDRAVQHEGVVVEVSEELAVLVRHPNAAVVDAHLGDLDTPIHDREHAQHRGHQ